MGKTVETERGHYIKMDVSDWLKTQDGKNLLSSCPRIGLPTMHIPGKNPSRHSQILLPFEDGESQFKKYFTDYMWYSICAHAIKHQFHHGLIWLVNEKE